MRNTIFILAIFSGILTSCSNSNADYASYEDTTASSSEMSQKLAFNDNANYAQEAGEEADGSENQKTDNNRKQIPGQPQEETETKIIKEGSLGITVKDFVEARSGLDLLIKKYKL